MSPTARRRPETPELAAATADEKKQVFELAEVQHKVDLFEVLELQSRWIGAQAALLDVTGQRLDERVTCTWSWAEASSRSATKPGPKPTERQALTP